MKLKLGVLGMGMVGKSNLTFKFINRDLPEMEYDATIEDKYKTGIDIGDVHCELGKIL